MPDTGTSESPSTWAVQAGIDGAWRTVSSPYADREEALDRLDWHRAMAASGLAFRLEVVTTTVTTTYETPTNSSVTPKEN